MRVADTGPHHCDGSLNRGADRQYPTALATAISASAVRFPTLEPYVSHEVSSRNDCTQCYENDSHSLYSSLTAGFFQTMELSGVVKIRVGKAPQLSEVPIMTCTPR